MCRDLRDGILGGVDDVVGRRLRRHGSQRECQRQRKADEFSNAGESVHVSLSSLFVDGSIIPVSYYTSRCV